MALRPLRASSVGESSVAAWLPGGGRALVALAMIPVAMLCASAVGVAASTKGLIAKVAQLRVR